MGIAQMKATDFGTGDRTLTPTMLRCWLLTVRREVQ
jgi:hypothetical protein